MARFLCLDRWGQPSKTEQRNGMPLHAEASRVPRKGLNEGRDAKNLAAMSAYLPMAGLEIGREIRLSESAVIFTAFGNGLCKTAPEPTKHCAVQRNATPTNAGKVGVTRLQLQRGARGQCRCSPIAPASLRSASRLSH
jgi:hypothetical protein